MKSLNTLIKINTRSLDELRKAVVMLEEEKIRLISNNQNLEEQLTKEHSLASSDPQMGIAFANYRRFVRTKQADIEKSIKKITKKIEELKDDIAEKFGEVKKYEIILAGKILEEQKSMNSRELKELDSIAINNYLQSEGETK